MNISEYIRLCCVKRNNISIAELARRTNQTSQNLSNKIGRNDFKLSDLEKIAAALNCDLSLQFIDKETKQPMF